MTAVVTLIEDTASLRMLYAAVLRRAGFEVRQAATAEEGLELFRAKPTEAVMLDLMLPDRDGLDLMRDLLALRPRTGVIAITANGSILRAIEAMRAGASDFLVKPFDETRMISATRNALAAHAMRDAPDRSAPPPTPPSALRQGAHARPDPPPAAPVSRRAEPSPPPAAAPARRHETPSEAPAPAPGGDPSDTAGEAEGLARLVGTSPAMQQVHALIRRSARSMATIFLTGEGGTGKERHARTIHMLSPRARGPYVGLDCAALPAAEQDAELFGQAHPGGGERPGALARADGGTLFLDGICALSPAAQAKLVRVMQTSAVHPAGAPHPRRVDVRIVCATTRDPAEELRRGRFREDLYYRLHVVPIHLPPLRARGADTLEIAERALARYAAAEGKRFAGLSEEVKALFLQLPWPGNVRQLLNVLRNAVVLHDGPLLTVEMLPAEALAISLPDPGEAGADPGIPIPPPGGGPVAVPSGGGAAEADRMRPAADLHASVAALRGRSLEEVERIVIEDAIALHGGSVSRAAQILGVSPSTIYRKREAWKRRDGTR